MIRVNCNHFDTFKRNVNISVVEKQCVTDGGNLKSLWSDVQQTTVCLHALAVFGHVVFQKKCDIALLCNIMHGNGV